MQDPMTEPLLFYPGTRLLYLLLALALSPCARAQSYSEDMSTMAAQEFYEDVQRRISASTHDGPTHYLSRDYTLTPEQEQWLEERRQNDERLNELRKDPVLMRFVNGYWEHYPSRESTGADQRCAATYANLDGLLTLTSVDTRWEGGLLMFMGKDIPKPGAFTEITATLAQSGGSSATVRIFNARSIPEMRDLGTLIFAVPSMKAALASMEDTESFSIAIEGKSVFNMEWKDGIKARNALRQCLRNG
jgi:hypothetical protein